MVDVIIWTPIERMLSGILFFLMLIAAMIYLYRARQYENKEQKIVLYGFSFFIFFLLISNIFIFWNDLNIPGEFRNNAFYGDSLSSNETTVVLVYFGLIFQALSFTVLTLAIELILRRTKFVLSLLNLFWLVMVIINPPILDSINSIFVIFNSVIMLIFLFILMDWSQEEFKAAALFIIFGTILSLVSSALDIHNTKVINIAPQELTVFLTIVSTLFFILPLTLNPSIFKNTLRSWIIFGFSSILFCVIAVIIGAIIFAMNGVESDVIIYGFIFTVIVIILFFRSRHILFEKEKRIKHPSGLTERKGFLNIFTKPQNLSEEEISVSKERKVCLVCKGKVLGFNSFICKCDAIYCQNCARTLSEMENACWVCNAALDETKPVKRVKEEKTKEIDVEQGIKLKKGK